MNEPARASVPALDDLGRPTEFRMEVQGGMLEALGINMYTSIGKCLVEFIANAYDSDATRCDVMIPFEKIEAARVIIREEAKKAVASGTKEKFKILLDPLPADIAITIADDGHGMDALSVQNKFLPLNRNRRAEAGNAAPMSQSGKRWVMGRKGLGKLAGFGAAEHVKISTTKEGDEYATVFELRYEDLHQTRSITDYPIIPTYEPAPKERHGTSVTLSRLRCDALMSKRETIEDTISDNFYGIMPEDFAVHINDLDNPLRPKDVFYEYSHPAVRDATDDLAPVAVELEDGEEVHLRYVVRFRARSTDVHPPDEKRLMGHLPAKRRGARIYCNKRLAAGPSLFDTTTGVHNFLSNAYMECVVEADELDRLNVIDLVNTNRSDLRRDNDVVDRVIRKVSELMEDALRAHGNWRDHNAEDQLRAGRTSQMIIRIVDQLPNEQRKSAHKVLVTLASISGVEGELFTETAPLIVNSLNAGRVLVRLMELTHSVEAVRDVTDSLSELASIERSDAWKLYVGRKNGIQALQLLMERGEDEWRQAKFEADLHNLLKKYPWLIRPEYTQYLTSDKEMAHVVKSISKELQIDTFAAAGDGKRPDLVFALQDIQDVHQIVVVELKSPNIPLSNEHLGQLDGYIAQIRAYVRAEVDHEVLVRGYLIGTLPEANTKNLNQMALLEARRESRPSTEIISIRDLLTRAYNVHSEMLQAIQKEQPSLAPDGGNAAAAIAPGTPAVALPKAAEVAAPP
jgi:hypothetical protein